MPAQQKVVQLVSVCADDVEDSVSFLFHTALLYSPLIALLEQYCCGFVVFDCDRSESLTWCYTIDF